MNIAVIGSRTFDDYDLLVKVLDPYLLSVTRIVSGGAKGADKLAEQYAKANNLDILVFVPDWQALGKRAGFLRNIKIIDNCDLVVAFWDGKSKGTRHSLDYALKTKKKVKVEITT